MKIKAYYLNWGASDDDNIKEAAEELFFKLHTSFDLTEENLKSRDIFNKFAKKEFYDKTFEYDIEEIYDDDYIYLNTVFDDLNADDRPNGKTHRSLSVGDIIELNNYRTYLVCGMGFAAIDLKSIL